VHLVCQQLHWEILKNKDFLPTYHFFKSSSVCSAGHLVYVALVLSVFKKKSHKVIIPPTHHIIGLHLGGRRVAACLYLYFVEICINPAGIGSWSRYWKEDSRMSAPLLPRHFCLSALAPCKEGFDRKILIFFYFRGSNA
jgi:hypothetical protein